MAKGESLVEEVLDTVSRGGWLVMAAFVPPFSLLVWRVSGETVNLTAVVVVVGVICAFLLGLVAGRSGLLWMIMLAGVAVRLFLADELQAHGTVHYNC